MEMIKGLSILVLTLILFSGFSIKAPKGQSAMSGLANAAVATFLVEAIHKYISGDFFNISILNDVGLSSGSMGGVAATTLTMINMGVNPVLAMSAGVAVGGFGILPGFIAGYLGGLIAPYIEKKIPQGLNIIFGALLIAPFARLIAIATNPVIESTLSNIGNMISVAADQSPYIMGFMLGGIIKVMCTSPLSSMALTAMLGLTGLPMGIAAIATVGGSFTNGILFKKLNLGDNSKIVAVMLEPLTQADIVSQNAVSIYSSNFLGGGLAGLSASYFHIINNAPGTASPIPGLIAPFAFNSPSSVILALAFAVLGGIVGGLVGGTFFASIKKSKGRKLLRYGFISLFR